MIAARPCQANHCSSAAPIKAPNSGRLTLDQEIEASNPRPLSTVLSQNAEVIEQEMTIVGLADILGDLVAEAMEQDVTIVVVPGILGDLVVDVVVNVVDGTRSARPER